MSKNSLHYNERRRHQSSYPNTESRSNKNCASLSCDVDARITCGGKTFHPKLIGNDGKDHHRKSLINIILINQNHTKIRMNFPC